MINFTVGPVQMGDEIRNIGSEQVPYFRTNDFSKLMFENERMFLNLLNGPEKSRAVFITGSGTASMEASIINVLSKDDKVLVVNGGSFGQRFVDILTIHDIPFEQIKLPFGKALTSKDLDNFKNKGFTAFVLQGHETSTGVKYNLDIVSEFCKSEKLLLIIDAISMFLADEIDMKQLGADVIITGSQKALACPPGISLIALSDRAVKRIENNNPHCLYLDLKSALLNGERGQTPFTPAVSILIQIHKRLELICQNGGAIKEIKRVKELANYFRINLNGLPFEIASESMSNAVTPLKPLTASAYDIFTVLKDEYNIWICPSGGELKDTLFRVGHIGCLTKTDYDKLIAAFKDLQKRKII